MNRVVPSAAWPILPFSPLIISIINSSLFTPYSYYCAVPLRHAACDRLGVHFPRLTTCTRVFRSDTVMSAVLARLKKQKEAQEAKLAAMRERPYPGLPGLKIKRPATCRMCHFPKKSSHRSIDVITGKEIHACTAHDLCRDFSRCQYLAGHPEIKVERRLEKLEAKTQAVQARLDRQVILSTVSLLTRDAFIAG